MIKIYQKEIKKKLEPKNETLKAILNYSKSLEVVKTNKSMIINLN